jgi:hypothetical protein
MWDSKKLTMERGISQDVKKNRHKFRSTSKQDQAKCTVRKETYILVKLNSLYLSSIPQTVTELFSETSHIIFNSGKRPKKIFPQ